MKIVRAASCSRSVNQIKMANKLIEYVNSNENYEPTEVMEVLLSMTRDEVIVFLTWNDSNGVYLDLECRNEGLEPLTEVTAKLYAFKVLWENAPIKQKVNDDVFNQLGNILKP